MENLEELDRETQNTEPLGKMQERQSARIRSNQSVSENKHQNMMGRIRIKLDNTRESIHNLISQF